MGWAGNIERIRVTVDAFKILVRKCEGKKNIERVRDGTYGSINMDVKEI